MEVPGQRMEHQFHVGDGALLVACGAVGSERDRIAEVVLRCIGKTHLQVGDAALPVEFRRGGVARRRLDRGVR